MGQIDLNTLWQNFIDTITNHYSDLNGRVGRAQFWCYILVYTVVGFAISFVSSIVLFSGAVPVLFGLALLLPSIGMTARRLQDTGRPGSLAWLLAVPIGIGTVLFLFAIISFLTFGLGAILFVLRPVLSLASAGAILVLIVFCVQQGQPGANEYGPEPPPWPPATPQAKS